jgi:hypothetical protein
MKSNETGPIFFLKEGEEKWREDRDKEW